MSEEGKQPEDPAAGEATVSGASGNSADRASENPGCAAAASECAEKAEGFKDAARDEALAAAEKGLEAARAALAAAEARLAEAQRAAACKRAEGGPDGNAIPVEPVEASSRRGEERAARQGEEGRSRESAAVSESRAQPAPESQPATYPPPTGSAVGDAQPNPQVADAQSADSWQGGSQRGSSQQYRPPVQPHYAAQAPSRDHVAAGLLAIFLGGFGVHKFYLGYSTQGFITLAVFLLGGLLSFGIVSSIMWIIAIVEGVIYLSKSQSEFERIYVYGKREWF